MPGEVYSKHLRPEVGMSVSRSANRAQKEIRMDGRSWAGAMAGTALLAIIIRALWSRIMTSKAVSEPYIEIPGATARPDVTPTGILEPLTLQSISQRVGDTYREGYLTLLAIIQGVALGILIPEIQQQWLQNPAASYRTRIATQALATLIIVIVTTHRYLLLTVIGRWVPTVFDTVIPYALGVCEISAAVTIGRNIAWWCSVAVFSVSAVSAFVHSRVRMPAVAFGELRPLYNRFRHATSVAIITFSLLASTSTGIVLTSLLGGGTSWFFALAPIISIAAVIAFQATANYQISSLG